MVRLFRIQRGRALRGEEWAGQGATTLTVTAGAALVGFLTAALQGKVLIPVLHRLKFGQTIREEGPAWHRAKQGTPTMGRGAVYHRFSRGGAAGDYRRAVSAAR